MAESLNSEIGGEALREEAAQRYFEDLDLDWDQLRGRVVLDIGAGLADFAVIAKRHGIQVTSVEKSPENYMQGQPPNDVPYVVGDARQMPFETQSFDVVLSHAGPITNVESITDFSAMLSEADRVLKPGGEFRFGPVWVHPSVFGWAKILSKDEEDHLSEQERAILINERVFVFLKQTDSRFERWVSRQSSRTEPFNQYYILRKPITEEGSNTGLSVTA